MNCIRQLSSNQPTKPGHCPASFDFAHCWPETPANTSVALRCDVFEDIIYEDQRYAYRFCFPNGTWESIADYRDCIPTEDEEAFSVPMVNKLYMIFWIGHPLSLLFCLLALAIFFRYRSLWCLRNIIHSNVILCFTLYNGLWIGYSVLYEELHVSTSPFMKCIIPLALLRFFFCAAFFWMFVEGLYIFINLLYSLHSPKINFWSCFFIGWILPIFPVSFAVFVAENDLHSPRCLELSRSHVDYIILVPIAIIIIANFCFLCKILYVVASKLRLSVNNRFQVYSKAVRALLVLCPLLGINFMIVLYHPVSPRWLNVTIHYITAITASTQGALVAIFFCFRNKEVQDCLGRSFASLKLSLRLRKERNKRRGSSRRSEHSQITLLSVPPSPTPYVSEEA